MTANPYIVGTDASNGAAFYLSDPGLPPIHPQESNATLRVAADGSMEVDVPFNQEDLTLQSLSSSSDVAVTSVERGRKINWGSKDPDPAYSDRITQVTAKLGNTSGEYTFGSAVEYVVNLRAEQRWDVHLGVDLAGAQLKVNEKFVQEYREPETGIKVRVTAAKNDPLIASLRTAKLRVGTQAPDFDAIAEHMKDQFLVAPQLQTWNLALELDGKPIVLGERYGISVELPTTGTLPIVAHAGGDTLVLVEAELSDSGTVSFAPASLGTFALVYYETAVPWAGRKDFFSEAGTSMTYGTTGVADLKYPGIDVGSWEAHGVYHSVMGEETSSVRLAEARRLLSSVGTDLELHAYTYGFQRSTEQAPLAHTAKQEAWQSPLGGGQTNLIATAPGRDRDDQVYLFRGTIGAGLQKFERLRSAYDGGHLGFRLVEKNTDLASPAAKLAIPLWNAATGNDGNIDTRQTNDTEIAYIVVARDALTRIEKPTAVDGLRYTGEEQIGVVEGEGYSLSEEPRAKNAGTHIARATLKEGFGWRGGGTEPVEVRWELEQALLEAHYAGEKIAANAEPQLHVHTTGFVNGETPETAAAYVAPRVPRPERLTAGGSYRLAPTGGSATNYRFHYREGVLNVDHQIDTSHWKPGNYRITANLFVPASQNDLFGRTEFLTNPKNPLAPEGSTHHGIPLEPVRDNATLTVGTDGKRTLQVEFPNPAFVLVEFGAPSTGISVAGVQRDGKKIGAHGAGRITSAVFALGGSAATENFAQSKVYAAPLGLDKTWDLSLEIDFASAKRIPDTTTEAPGNAQQDDSNGQGSATKPQVGADASQQPTQVQAGTHTISANIWIDENVTGLPIDSHLTNDSFPPKDPVTNNASLSVDVEGNGMVTVPIANQNRFMNVRNLSGGGIVSSTGTSAISSVTVDLGRIDPSLKSVTRTLDAAVTIGDLALDLGDQGLAENLERNWPATLEVVLAGVPTSGGGVLPDIIRAKSHGSLTPDEATALTALEAAQQTDAAAQGFQGAGLAAAGREQLPRTGAVVASMSALLALTLICAALLLRRRARQALAAEHSEREAAE